MTSKLIVAVALCAVVGCKNKQADGPPATGSAPATAVDAAAAAPVAIDAAEPVDAVPASATIKLDVPEGWDRMDEGDGGTIELMVPTNETKFPVDNALFTFTFGPATGDGTPTEKPVKTEKLGDATHYTFAKSWLVVTKLGDKVWQCGGSDYKDADYNKIPKIRDEAVATAKKICASMKR
jgi:hypothetical protein